MQLAGFHMLAIDPQDRRLVLPQRSARCSSAPMPAGRTDNLEARLRSRTKNLSPGRQGLTIKAAL